MFFRRNGEFYERCVDFTGRRQLVAGDCCSIAQINWKFFINMASRYTLSLFLRLWPTLGGFFAAIVCMSLNQ